MTSAEMNKELKRLQYERGQILEQERQASSFVAATTEDLDEVRPEYDLPAVNEALAKTEKEIRGIKHRLNVFNSTYLIEDLGMTIDEVLVFLPQQSERVTKLAEFAKRAPRLRWSDRYGSRGNLIEYEYANYSRADAMRLYEEANSALVRAQIALDRVNTTVDIP